jgi:hypothetical protein
VSGARINSSTEGQFGALSLTVGDGDVTGITLPVTAGSTISGTLVIDSTNPSTRPSRAQITVTPVPSDFDANPFSNWATAGIGPDGRFTLAGISGTRRIAVGVPAGWTVKAIRSNGADVTDRLLPFGTSDQSLTDVEIVLTDRVSELTGRLADDRGRPIGGIPVIVFAASRDRWYPASRFLRRTTTRDDGQFVVTGLPGGDYYVAAVARVPDDGADAWQDPDFLDVLQRSASFVSILDGERASVRARLP